ncbi:MAG: hypothetical protein KA807_08580 [Prolixibacteraceae bacterium]|nr:hypothetical protein [Prolixibacteraceae bacterium]
MIHCLLTGNEKDIKFYSEIISKVKFFQGIDILYPDENNEVHIDKYSANEYDAYIFVSYIKNAYQIFLELIKAKANIYFIDQPLLSLTELTDLEQYIDESGNIIQVEIIEIQHPLMEEFISSKGSQLLFRYNKSVSSRKQIRPSVLTALSFLTLMSPMPVKKIDINTIETTNTGRPFIKIRLKMYDSSICLIMLKIDNKNEHSILIESNIGVFTFNLTDNYLENVHGTRFKSDKISDAELIEKSLESFAMNVIMNKKPSFSFHHYIQSVTVLSKIENILNEHTF